MSKDLRRASIAEMENLNSAIKLKLVEQIKLELEYN